MDEAGGSLALRLKGGGTRARVVDYLQLDLGEAGAFGAVVRPGGEKGFHGEREIANLGDNEEAPTGWRFAGAAAGDLPGEEGELAVARATRAWGSTGGERSE